MNPQQINQGYPHVFFSIILLYLNYMEKYKLTRLIFYLFLVSYYL